MEKDTESISFEDAAEKLDISLEELVLFLKSDSGMKKFTLLPAGFSTHSAFNVAMNFAKRRGHKGVRGLHGNVISSSTFQEDIDNFYKSIGAYAVFDGQLLNRFALSKSDVESYARKKFAHATGSNKDNARIHTTRQACGEVRAEIEQGQHGFQVRGGYKTNQDHFQQAVQAILGDIKPHRDTMADEWKKVREEIKHSGRVPEQ